MSLRHALQPHRLPDSAGRNVLYTLFSMRVRPGVCRIPNPQHQLIDSGLQGVCNIDREVLVAAAMGPHCTPFTYTVASKSTASKCSSVRYPPASAPADPAFDLKS